jgi:hypothetical protein
MNKQMTHAYAATVIEWRDNKLQTNQEIGGRHLMAYCAALTKRRARLGALERVRIEGGAV